MQSPQAPDPTTTIAISFVQTLVLEAMSRGSEYYRGCPRCRARRFDSEAHYTQHVVLCDEEPSPRQERKRELRIEQHIRRSGGGGPRILGGDEGLLARAPGPMGGGRGPRGGEEFLGQGATGGEQFLSGGAQGPTCAEQFLGRRAGGAGEHGRRRTPITLGDFFTGGILDQGGRGRVGGDRETLGGEPGLGAGHGRGPQIAGGYEEMLGGVPGRRRPGVEEEIWGGVPGRGAGHGRGPLNTGGDGETLEGVPGVGAGRGRALITGGAEDTLGGVGDNETMLGVPGRGVGRGRGGRALFADVVSRRYAEVGQAHFVDATAERNADDDSLKVDTNDVAARYVDIVRGVKKN